MPLKREQSIIANHAAAVVDNLDQFPPAGFHIDANAFRSGIERILQQFLNHGRRTLHHFASSDLVGDIFGKNVDATHRFDCKWRKVGGSWKLVAWALTCQLTPLPLRDNG